MFVPCTEKGHRKLGDLTGASDHDKVEVWARVLEDGTETLELVEFSWGSGIGWYVQKRIRLDADQVAALRLLLGSNGVPSPRPKRTLPGVVREDGVIRLLFSS